MEENFNESCPSEQKKLINVEVGSDDYYRFCYNAYSRVPKELWPEGYNIIPNDWQHVRETVSMPVEKVNLSNKDIVDKAAKKYKEKHPEIENPLEEDHFWNEYGVADAVIANAIANRDYIFDGDEIYWSEDKEKKKELKDCLKQFDVVIQESIGGRVQHPYVIYDIDVKNKVMAYEKYDDFAKKAFDEFNKKWEIDDGKSGKKYVKSDEQLKKWQEVGVAEHYRLIDKLIDEGHITFEIKHTGKEYKAKIRWVEHTSDNKNILHKTQY